MFVVQSGLLDITASPPGDNDENVFVVQSGLLDVFITEPDGRASTLKYVGAGDSVTSLLSFCDVLTVSEDTGDVGRWQGMTHVDDWLSSIQTLS